MFSGWLEDGHCMSALLPILTKIAPSAKGETYHESLWALAQGQWQTPAKAAISPGNAAR